jgi:hypothetical protein
LLCRLRTARILPPKKIIARLNKKLNEKIVTPRLLDWFERISAPIAGGQTRSGGGRNLKKSPSKLLRNLENKSFKTLYF